MHKLKKIFLMLGDIAILYGSLYLTLLIRYQELPSPGTWGQHFVPFTAVFFVWLLIFYISNLYSLHLPATSLSFYRVAGRSVLVSAGLTALFFYLSPAIEIEPKTNLVIFILVFSILFFVWRYIFNLSLGSYLPKKQVAFIGYNEQVQELINVIKEIPHLGYRTAAVLTENAEAGHKLFLPPDTELVELTRKKHLSTIVFASNPHKSDKLRTSMFACLPYKVNFVSLPNFYESITGKVPIEAINQMWFLENLNEGNKTWFDIVKRLYDIVLALIIFLITLPFWPFIAMAIKLDSPGPVFFTQKRAGRHNRPFTMVKFRSMKTDDNDYHPTAEKDVRITALGNLLRKTRVDELPQLLNIILGDMSFVGPRPERPELIRKLEKQIPFYGQRMLVKPGLTGSDQISGEYHSPSYEDTLKKLQYDLFYIKNRSIYLDLSIILKTVMTVLSRSGR
jgi:exopolysaccharide biosynthesis polyprenyl glycosylphosphotransferase